MLSVLQIFRHLNKGLANYVARSGVERYAAPRKCLSQFNKLNRNAFLEHKFICSFIQHKKDVSSSSIDGTMSHSLPYVEEFDMTYKYVIDLLSQKNDDIPQAAAERLIRVMDYNVLGGKKIRGLSVVLAYNMMSRDSTFPNKMKLAFILGWCVEMLQGVFILYDDIMDDGTMRRGKPCWFRLPDVGFESVNDGLLLETSIYKLIKMHFFDTKQYDKILNEFLEVTRKTVYGQCLDMSSNPSNQPPRLEKFSMSYYKSVVELKTSHYTFCLPIHLAMHLIGSFEKEHYEIVEAICIKLGSLFQMQDDYLDVYGTCDVTGKTSSDIKEGKCNWFSAMAIENCTEVGKELMKENYGVDDAVAVQKVLQLYDTMGLKEKYFNMEQNLHAEILSHISDLDTDVLNPELFTSLLNYIYRRKK